MAQEKAEHLKQLSERLQQLRKQHGWSQEKAAEELGVPVGTYAPWERGKFAPRLEQLVAVADRYNVSLDYLLGRAGAAAQSIVAGDIRWRLAWSGPPRGFERGAAIWERLVRGEPRKKISADLEISNDHLERHVQDLVLSNSLVLEAVARNRSLERELRQRFVDEEGRARLRDVWIANLSHIEWPFVRYVLLGHLAKEHFLREVQPGAAVGLCGGFAVSRMVHSLQRGECPGGIRVFPVAVTPVFEKARVSANSTVSALAYRHFDSGVQSSEMTFLFDDVAGPPFSPPWRIATRILEDATRVEFVFMGIGGRDTGALAKDISDVQRDYQWLAEVDIAVIQRQGQAVGDILYHLIDRAGEPLAGFAEQNRKLVCSIGLDGLRQLVDRGKRVVVIASGHKKADVTRAAIVGRYANVLIIDDALAQALIDA